jgi:N-acetylglucosamine kinase-like BadF-type ATPase
LEARVTEKVYLGADCGGSKSKMVLLDAAGQIIAEHIGLGCNYNHLGLERTVAVIAELSAELLGVAQQQKTAVAAAHLGIAGVMSGSSEATQIAAALQGIIAVNVKVENDTHIAWYAGTLGEPGMVIISGTGSNAYAVDDLGHCHQVGGWGWLLGDEGSGYFIGSAGVRQAIYAIEQRGQQTSLAAGLLQFFAVKDLHQLMHKIDNYLQIAEFASVVHQHALEGDQSAREIIQLAVSHLLTHVKRLNEMAVFTVPSTTRPLIPIIGQGSCFRHMQLLREQFSLGIKSIDARFELLLPIRSAAHGAALLALNENRHK